MRKNLKPDENAISNVKSYQEWLLVHSSILNSFIIWREMEPKIVTASTLTVTLRLI